MENCLYKGKAICTFDLKDESGFYYEGSVLEWKQAAADRQLTCTECGAHVYLAAGPVKEPYFAHYDLEACDYGNGHETEELKKGKRLLYQLLKRSFSGADIQARYRMDNDLYSTLFCIPEGSKAIAVDFRLQSNSLEKFRLRDSYYQSNDIVPLYVMGIRQNRNTKQIDWFQNLIQTSMDYLVFLDTDKETIVLKKSFSYRLGKERKFAFCEEVYSMKDLVLDSSGQMVCDFTQGLKKTELKIQEEKEHFLKFQKNVRELKEQQQRLEMHEQERMEQFRRLKEQERMEQFRRLKEQERMEQFRRLKEQESNGGIEVSNLDLGLLEKCRRMIEEGNAHLVSKKYYDAICGIK